MYANDTAESDRRTFYWRLAQLTVSRIRETEGGGSDRRRARLQKILSYVMKRATWSSPDLAWGNRCA